MANAKKSPRAITRRMCLNCLFFHALFVFVVCLFEIAAKCALSSFTAELNSHWIPSTHSALSTAKNAIGAKVRIKMHSTSDLLCLSNKTQFYGRTRQKFLATNVSSTHTIFEISIKYLDDFLFHALKSQQ